MERTVSIVGRDVSSDRRVLALLDAVTAKTLGDRVAELERRGVRTKVVDYQNLMCCAEELRALVNGHKIEMILFSRNDQVYERNSIGPLIRALRVGYSTFSGIDSEYALEQTAVCLDDFLASGKNLEIAERVHSVAPSVHQEGTFSLLFDMEQLACARFGLPRILNLLDQYDAKATFFTTNFVHKIYPNVLEIVARRGHEVGLHGLYHEYLAGHTRDQQAEMIRQMKSSFERFTPISGANFLGRADQSSVDAMVVNGLRYFVVFMEHRYGAFAYRKMRLRPLLASSPHGTIWVIPISIETNNRPWIPVRNMIDSARIAGRREGFPHINILLHPFRDGSLRHIEDLKRILMYLQGKWGYRGIPLGRLADRLQTYKPSSFVYFVSDPQQSHEGKRGFRQKWWNYTPRYQQRVCNVYEALAENQQRPAVCFDMPAEGTVYAVHPHIPEGITPSTLIERDPLLFPAAVAKAVCGSVHRPGLRLHAIVPGSLGRDLLAAIHALPPRSHHDYAGLFTETAMRVAYRLSGNRHLF